MLQVPHNVDWALLMTSKMISNSNKDTVFNNTVWNPMWKSFPFFFNYSDYDK